MKTKLSVDKSIIITPFNTNAVICFHQLSISGVHPCAFFDENHLLEGKSYQGNYIQKCYYRKNTVIINAGGESYKDSICQNFLRIGYKEDEIVFYEELDLPVNMYDAAEKVNLDEFLSLSPQNAKAYGGRLKVRKLRKLKELGAPSDNINYDMFDETKEIHDTYMDASGLKHVFLKDADLVLTTRCSLRCRYCCNGMQYFEKPQDIAHDVIISDYNRLLKAVEWIDRLVLVGGEAFVYKDFSNVLKGIIANEDTMNKVGEIVVLSNGTVLPDESTLKLLSGNNITVNISNYRDRSIKIPEMVDLFQRNNIMYSISDIKSWSMVMQLQDREEQLDESVLLEYRDICNTNCRSIAEGKFYMCSLSYSFEKLNAVPADDRNHVDLYSDDLTEKLFEFLRRDRSMPPCCSWCSACSKHVWNSRTIPAAEQAKKPIQYRKFV